MSMSEHEMRAAKARSWLAQVRTPPAGEPFLARRSDGVVCLVEGRARREIPSGLVAVALGSVFGQPRDATDEELRQLDEGAPVEIFEASGVKPFVVAGGRRMAVLGLPLPHPVDGDDAREIPEGPELHVVSSNVPRSEFEDALSGKYQIRAARRAIASKGLVPAVRSWGARTWHHLTGAKTG